MAKTKTAAAAKKPTRPKNDPLSDLDRKRLATALQVTLTNARQLQDALDAPPKKDTLAEELSLVAEDFACSSAVLADVASHLLLASAPQAIADRGEE